MNAVLSKMPSVVHREVSGLRQDARTAFAGADGSGTVDRRECRSIDAD